MMVFCTFSADEVQADPIPGVDHRLGQLLKVDLAKLHAL